MGGELKYVGTGKSLMGKWERCFATDSGGQSQYGDQRIHDFQSRELHCRGSVLRNGVYQQRSEHGHTESTCTGISSAPPSSKSIIHTGDYGTITSGAAD